MTQFGSKSENLVCKFQKILLTPPVRLLLSRLLFREQSRGVLSLLTKVKMRLTCLGFIVEREGFLQRLPVRSCSSVVEHVLGKDEVLGSSPNMSSMSHEARKRSPQTSQNKKAQAH